MFRVICIYYRNSNKLVRFLGMTGFSLSKVVKSSETMLQGLTAFGWESTEDVNFCVKAVYKF